MEKNKFGLSRKTNIVLGSFACISVVKDNPWAIAAVVLLTLVAITYQFIIDFWKNAKNK